MRSASRVLLACLLVASACSQEFTGIDESSAAGAGGSATAGRSGSGGKSSGSAGRAGGSSVAGGGGSKPVDPITGGTLGVAGALAVGGLPGLGGNGGAEPVGIPAEGLELWLRADAGVVEDDGVVSAWKDSSTRGRDASQDASNQRPKLVDGVLGNHRALVFDGDDDYFTLPAMDVDFSAGVSIFVAGRQDVAADVVAYFEASNGQEADDVHLGTYQGAPLYEVMVPFLHAQNYPVVPTAPEILVALHQPSGMVRLRRNSNGLADMSFPLPETVRRNEVFVGYCLYDKCTPLEGVVGELIVYSRAVSSEELVQIESYLQKKWSCCQP